jgi:hypothetical protein
LFVEYRNISFVKKQKKYKILNLYFNTAHRYQNFFDEFRLPYIAYLVRSDLNKEIILEIFSKPLLREYYLFGENIAGKVDQ